MVLDMQPKPTEEPKKEPAPISDVEQYKEVTSMMRYYNDKIFDTFKMYIQLASAIAGGYVWLRIQAGPTALDLARYVAPALTLLVGIGAILLIAINLGSWWGYRKRLSELLNRPNLRPEFPRNGYQEVIMGVFILLASAGAFWYFTR